MYSLELVSTAAMTDGWGLQHSLSLSLSRWDLQTIRPRCDLILSLSLSQLVSTAAMTDGWGLQHRVSLSLSLSLSPGTFGRVVKRAVKPRFRRGIETCWEGDGNVETFPVAIMSRFNNPETVHRVG